MANPVGPSDFNLFGANPILNNGVPLQGYSPAAPFGTDPAGLASRTDPTAKASDRLKGIAQRVNDERFGGSTKSTLSAGRKGRIQPPRPVFTGNLKQVAGGKVIGKSSDVCKALDKHRGEVIVKDEHGEVVYAYERDPVTGAWKGYNARDWSPLPPGSSPSSLVAQMSASPQGLRFTMFIVEDGKARADRLCGDHTRSSAPSLSDLNGRRRSDYFASTAPARGSAGLYAEYLEAKRAGTVGPDETYSSWLSARPRAETRITEEDGEEDGPTMTSPFEDLEAEAPEAPPSPLTPSIASQA